MPFASLDILIVLIWMIAAVWPHYRCVAAGPFLEWSICEYIWVSLCSLSKIDAFRSTA